MRRYIRLPLIFLVASLLALLLVAVAGQQYRLFERGWFNLKTWWQPFEQSIGLDQYQVVLEAQPIEGLDDDISALTFDPDRNSLFTVTNKRSELIELSLDGRILRRVPLTGFGDPEAVEYVGANSYVITDEREQRLIRVRLTDNTPFLDAKDAEQLTLGIGLNGNKGFEGLAYDSAGKRLFVAKERDPMLIYEVHGFPHDNPEQPYAVHVVQDQKRDSRLFVRDLSSLQFDERSGHLLALSDESQLVLELDVQGKPLSTLSLRKGFQGLNKSVPQAEGIAMDDAGTIYLVSEPNLFYVFKKPTE
ncbi:SdiA-regulated domain-containing protein [Pseudomonas sp. NPDC087612]|uniref:SdiA-regulated domain-containing protein n=1 Tax=unclassified Pseudomonas TaxID=196821 RepID=UPI0018A78007|nr:MULTISPECIES: SdiA-regulated domain-containing protein [unclassified Pseudomonas]QPG64699.1 SdiA-regulated domain-containing protein [Pseudomonas sp. BIGb0427]QVM96557.1 SdiA-regulated domain-containing protein [Pseudomonas sp. SORT22]UVL56581.1 SdiA-regulated domain-containing protein [Pseudomonas sp. B21-035]UVM56185.1 SdiA-regulated domain-containing protein [Pseudomonas sp. B21-012]UVM67136.1 SdiA-regulated domain-containing protein [Pseudomonas sp. B21-009]